MDDLITIEKNAFKSGDEQDETEKEIEAIYAEVLNLLVDKLNKYHGVQYSMSFWEIAVGKWLGVIIGNLYTRYLFCVKDMEEKKIESIVNNKSIIDRLDIRSIQFTKEYIEFLDASINDGIRRYWAFYDRISGSPKDRAPMVKCVKLYDNATPKVVVGGRNAISGSMKYLVSRRSWCAFSSYIDGEDVSIIELDEYKIREYVIDANGRNLIFKSLKPACGEFMYALMHFLNKNFPVTYLELFSDVLREVKSVYKETYKKYFVTDFTEFTNCKEVFFEALQKENGCKIICLQHGGGYGMMNAGFFYEYTVPDQFITFGWGMGKYKTMPNLLLLRNPYYKKYCNKGNRIILLSTLEVIERVIINGMLSYAGYRESIIKFINLFLHSTIHVEWRSYFARYSNIESNQKEYVKQRLVNKNVSIDLGGSVYDRIHKSRLVVLDHIQTTILELMGNNVPTIIFCDLEKYNLTDEAKNILDIFEQVGIYHRTPDSAASFVKNNFDNIDEWWISKPVQNAVNMFNNHFSRNSEDIISDYVKLFSGYTKRKHVLNWKYYCYVITQKLVEFIK